MPRRLKLKGGDEESNSTFENNNNSSNNYASVVESYQLPNRNGNRTSNNNGNGNSTSNNGNSTGNGNLNQLPNNNRNNLSDVPSASEITLILPASSTFVLSPSDEVAFRNGFSDAEPIRRIGDDVVVYNFATNDGSDVFFVEVDTTTGEVEEITRIFHNNNSEVNQKFYDDGSSMVTLTNPGFELLKPENITGRYPELQQYLKDVVATNVVYHIDNNRTPLEEEIIEFKTPTHLIKIQGDNVEIMENQIPSKNNNKSNNKNNNKSNKKILIYGLAGLAGYTAIALAGAQRFFKSSKPANTTAVVGGRRYKVHTGMRGGKYIIRNNKRMYV